MLRVWLRTYLLLLGVLVELFEEHVNVASAADKDRRTLVNGIRHDVQDALKARGALAASLLHDHRHGVGLVEQAKFAVLALLVSRVQEDAAVEQGAVQIGHHRAYVARRVGLVGGLDAVNKVGHRGVPVLAVALVDRVDGLGVLRDLDVLVGEDELADAGVVGEDVDAFAKSEDHLGRGAVHAVARGHEFRAGLQDILDRRLLVDIALVNAENGADGHVAVDVARAVERIEDGAVLAVGAVDNDHVLDLLRHHDANLGRVLEGADEVVVGQNVKLLHLLALHVDRALQPIHAEDAGLAHSSRDRLASELDG
mmetsp:Transcript_17531/g.44460  ORF Transcript_17531/g.44460 Transcript_17531/m.44460 type:complete len:311 (+) Transcript_17531:201-1133(+)